LNFSDAFGASHLLASAFALGFPIYRECDSGNNVRCVPNIGLQDTPEWQLVQIPTRHFSDDWSPFTGDCGTKDPTGKQHHCCGTGDAEQ
jgi:hypothetical protein